MKRKRQNRRSQKQQQSKFIQHWSPYDEKKQYNALEDPHANYYFYNKSVNQHLKQLKKAVNQQRNVKKKQQLKQLITSKLSSLKLPIIRGGASPKTAIYADQINKSVSNMPHSHRKKSQLNALSNKSRENKNQSSFSVAEINRYRKSNSNINNPDHVNSYRQSHQNKTDPKSIQKSNKNLKKRETQQNATQIQKNHRQNHNKFLNYLDERKKILTMNSTTAFISKTQHNQDQAKIN